MVADSTTCISIQGSMRGQRKEEWEGRKGQQSWFLQAYHIVQVGTRTAVCTMAVGRQVSSQNPGREEGRRGGGQNRKGKRREGEEEERERRGEEEWRGGVDGERGGEREQGSEGEHGRRGAVTSSNP